MSEHRYPRAIIRRDMFRAALGVALTVGPLLSMSPGKWVGILLGLLAALFLAYGCVTCLRARLVVACNPTEITLSGIKAVNLPWKALHRLDLRYYTVKRDRKQGWMQLTLEDRNSRLRIESTMEGFDRIVQTAVSAAKENGIVLSDATVANVTSMEIKVVTPYVKGGGE